MMVSIMVMMIATKTTKDEDEDDQDEDDHHDDMSSCIAVLGELCISSPIDPLLVITYL